MQVQPSLLTNMHPVFTKLDGGHASQWHRIVNCDDCLFLELGTNAWRQQTFRTPCFWSLQLCCWEKEPWLSFVVLSNNTPKQECNNIWLTLLTLVRKWTFIKLMFCCQMFIKTDHLLPPINDKSHRCLEGSFSQSSQNVKWCSWKSSGGGCLFNLSTNTVCSCHPKFDRHKNKTSSVRTNQSKWDVLTGLVRWHRLVDTLLGCANEELPPIFFFVAFIFGKHCFVSIVVCHLDGFDFVENHSCMSVNAVLHTGSQFETQLCVWAVGARLQFWQHSFLCGKEDGLNVPKRTRIHHEFLTVVDNTSLSYSAPGAKDIVNPWSSIFTFSHIEMGCLLWILSLKADLVFHCPHQWNHFFYSPLMKKSWFHLPLNDSLLWTWTAPTTPTTTIVLATPSS